MRRPVVATAAVAAVVLMVVVNFATDTVDLPGWSDPYVWIAVFLLALGGVVFQVRQTPPVPADDATTDRVLLDEVADHLAGTLRALWRKEEESRRLHDPFPLTLRWETADESLIDHWANIRRLPSGSTCGPLSLGGDLSRIRDAFRRIPSGRLVILGGAGSGKTVLALTLVQDLLDRRRTGEPVPVMVNLSSWNPDATPFRGWLVDQLLRDHPGLGRSGAGAELLAEELVDRRRILPVLDGFDEMANGLHPTALAALNRSGMPMVVTSRTEEFTAAVRSADVLTSAAAIEIADLRWNDVAAYLPRTAARRPPTGGSSDWVAVLEELRDHRPDDDAAANLTTVLSTPLMVWLARTIYSDAPNTNPKELLDPDKFGSTAAVRGHLLDAFLPAAYLLPRRLRSPDARTYSTANARRWLTHLAHGSDQEIAWWKVSGGVRKTTALALYTTIFATVFSVPFRFDVAAMLTLICVGAFATTFGRPPRPARAHFQIREFAAALKQEIAKGARGTLVEGLLFGGVLGIGFGLLVGFNTLDHGVAQGIAIGLACWIGGALVYMGTAQRPGVLSRSVNTSAAPCPIRMIADDRRCALVRSLVYGLAASVPTYGLFDLFRAVEMGAAVAVVFALSGTAWGRWIVIGRFWLPLTRRLPWTLNDFLDDAHDRAVLRQTGAVYEFRHILLRDNLRTTRGERSRPPL